MQQPAWFRSHVKVCFDLHLFSGMSIYTAGLHGRFLLGMCSLAYAPMIKWRVDYLGWNLGAKGLNQDVSA